MSIFSKEKWAHRCPDSNTRSIVVDILSEAFLLLLQVASLQQLQALPIDELDARCRPPHRTAHAASIT